MDAIALSRIQFGALAYFHLLFPAVTMTLGWVLLGLRLAALRSACGAWRHAYRFWVPVFAVTLALGFVSGAALLFQIDLSFPAFASLAGPVFRGAVWAAALGVFLQTAGLAITFLAPGRVSDERETAAMAVAALGATVAALWPVMLMGWMRSPAPLPEDWNWLHILANRETLLLAVQMLLASTVVTGLMLAGLSACRRLLGDSSRNAALTLRLGLRLAALGAGAALVFMQLRFGLPGAPLLVLGYAALLGAAFVLWPRPGQVSRAGALATIAAPLVGWALLLAGWHSGGALQSGWLIAGVLRLDSVLAAPNPYSTAATLPLYVATMLLLLGGYWAVLLLMARNAARATRPNVLRIAGGRPIGTPPQQPVAAR